MMAEALRHRRRRLLFNEDEVTTGCFFLLLCWIELSVQSSAPVPVAMDDAICNGVIDLVFIKSIMFPWRRLCRGS